MLLISASAFAADKEVETFRLEDDVAIVKLRIRNLHEPASSPLELSATLLCKDRRTRPTAEKPKERQLYYLIGVCYVGASELDKSTHRLAFNYSLSEVDKHFEAQCTNDQQKVFNLGILCEQWAP